MNSFQSLYNQINFLLANLTWFGLVDLALVTTSFYLILRLVRGSPAGYLMREILLLGLALFVLTALLPLPIFDWLVRGVLVATLVTTPIIFQAQIRRFFERISRVSGFGQMVGQSSAERVIPEITHAVERMTASQTGGLIVFEGKDSLEDIIKSGVPTGGKVSSELLESIFYVGTPLHDGAVVVRSDQIVAAGCVLPLTQQTLQAEKRLGTRHRAAVGMSEVSDALVIVVSEENGGVAVAYHGQLLRPLTILDLREKLLDFYDPPSDSPNSISLWRVITSVMPKLWPSNLSNPRKLLSNVGLLGVSLLLALVVWSFVIEQTNPFRLARVEGIDLRIENLPENTQLIPPPPDKVSAVIQTTNELLPTLNPSSFQATVSLEATAPGLYRLPIEINSGAKQVLVLSIDPPALDIELAPIISRTVPIRVNIPDQENLSAAYELVGVPTAIPNQVQIVGPAPIVEQVEQVQTSISLANATTSIRETRPLQAVDQQGREIASVAVQPNQARVSANIRPKLNAREVSVQPTLTGSPPPGYQMSKLSVVPDTVTLQGRIEQLLEINGVIDTLPVDISQATSDLTVQVPLNLPPNVQALGNNQSPARTVTVSVGITPRNGNLAVVRPVELLSPTSNLTITVEPSEVNLLLSGSQPLLNEIENNPNLVQVVIDTAALRRGQQTNVTPNLIAPAGIEAQFVPASIQIIVE